MKKFYASFLVILSFCVCSALKANAAVQTVFLDEKYIKHEQEEFLAKRKRERKDKETTELKNNKSKQKKSAAAIASPSSSTLNFSKEDIELLCKICHAESRGESTEGQMAVANVVINRVKSKKFPNTVKGVVFQKGQFTPASKSGFKSVVPSKKVRESVSRVLAGERVFGDDVLYFKSTSSPARWNKLKLNRRIGGHLFYAG